MARKRPGQVVSLGVEAGGSRSIFNIRLND
jgi:hypothetical protein